MQSNTKYKNISLNVRGLRDQTKRRSIFTYLKDQNANFYFLQETYSDANDELLWQSEWGGKILFSHGSHHSKGVCILFDPAINLNEEYNFSNKTGRIILITVYLNGVKISLCNIYAPNNQSEQLEFLKELNNCIIDKSEMTNIIIGGDWNCTLTFDLVDIYRTRHPNSQHFSYESKSLQVKSRIDFFLVAKFLVKFVSTVGITTSIAPDHKTLLLCLALPETTPRGPGFWKFNNTLLDDEEYTAHIPFLVLQIREKYSTVQDKQLFWELMKMEIREKSIRSAKQKSRVLSQREKEISKRLDYLDNIICNSNSLFNISDTSNEYEVLKTELHSIYDRKGKAAMFRSKCRWMEKGEKPTKYFFNLEKRNYNRKTINEIRTEDDVEIREE